ncbi:hypothetical protein GN244_ATG12345 [Phytophthora infestans]|uniref:Transmembrane protein n=1 Tax=Phytophthora infestans TaxID=4787 RepID=A0A833SLS3_PHYIN|nr:hypothetical protein GN244_ATG12345 [Phytophthora infestans]KAF4137225.1 hypothetical protein GN958_ATG13588 [Phytophthora infestans]KAF4140141.1 hypothetical protein GN958_ATG10670 [Phytophthora infestans]KAI9999304.1 hypothetical protein PInf_004129 [Phytophthora infestans]
MVAARLVQSLHDDTETLADVFTYAFLGLMTLFGTGCIFLKFSTVIAPSWSRILVVSKGVDSLKGNLLSDRTMLTYFLLYFIAELSVVYFSLEGAFLLRMYLYCLRQQCLFQRSNDEGETHSLRTSAHGGQEHFAAR